MEEEPKVISITQLLSPTSINAMKLHYSPFGKASKADGGERLDDDASLTRALESATRRSERCVSATLYIMRDDEEILLSLSGHAPSHRLLPCPYQVE